MHYQISENNLQKMDICQMMRLSWQLMGHYMVSHYWSSLTRGRERSSLALAMGQAFGLSVLRVQFYEGLTADKILYDYNYQDSYFPSRQYRVL